MRCWLLVPRKLVQVTLPCWTRLCWLTRRWLVDCWWCAQQSAGLRRGQCVCVASRRGGFLSCMTCFACQAYPYLITPQEKNYTLLFIICPINMTQMELSRNCHSQQTYCLLQGKGYCRNGKYPEKTKGMLLSGQHKSSFGCGGNTHQTLLPVFVIINEKNECYKTVRDC